MKISAKIMSVVFSLLIVLSTIAVPSFASTTESEPNGLAIKTELYVDDGTGNWLKAEKFEHGQNVKARIFIDTDYYAGHGNLIVFYNNDVFYDNYVRDTSTPLNVNNSVTSTTGIYKITGNFAKHDLNSERFIEKLIANNGLTIEFLEKNNSFTFSYSFPSGSTCQKLSGDEWFAEFDLIVKDDSFGEGKFFIAPETIRTEENDGATISVSRGEENLNANYAASMHTWTATSTLENQSVKVNTYNINYSFDGEAPCTPPASIPYAVTGDTVDLPIQSAYDGWTFYGWSVTGDLNGKVATEDVNVVGKWIKNTYTVNYWLDKAQTELYDTKTYSFGDTVINPANPSDSYFEAGTHFFDWNNDTISVIDADTVSTYFAESKNGKFVYNISALTEADEYTVNVYFTDVYGYENDIPVDSFGGLAYGDKIYPEDMPDTTFVDGYTFKNWIVNGEVVNSWPIEVTENIDIYGSFDAIKYKATFLAEGGQWPDGDTEKVLEFTYGQEITPPETLPVRDGYTFDMWDPDLGTMDIEDVTFTAFWVANEYNVIYNIEGDETSSTYKYGSDVNSPVPPSKVGYTFEGWKYENGDIVSFPFDMPSADVKLYASFIPNSYNAVFMNDDEVFETLSVKYGDKINAPVNIPRKEGYDFVGWSFDGINVTDDLGVMNENGGIFYAVWKEKEPEHIHTPEDVVIDATCTENGKSYTVCSSCGEKLSDDTIISAHGHNPGEWEIISEPTLNSDGKKIKKCVRCKEQVEESIIAKLQTAIDSDTLISVVYSPDDYNGAVSVDASVSNDSSLTDIIYKNVGPNKNTVYDIGMQSNGQNTEPQSTVKVSIPVPENYNPDTSAVYFVDKSTGKAEKINAKTEGGKLAFETDKLGNFAVVDMSKLAYSDVTLSINNPSKTTIKYGDTLILHINEKVVIPEGLMLQWSVTSGSGVRLSPSEDGMTCGVTSTGSGDVTVTVKLVDAEENAVPDINGEEIFAEQKIKSKGGFFWKIISFFKNLFKMNRIIANAFKQF